MKFQIMFIALLLTTIVSCQPTKQVATKENPEESTKKTTEKAPIKVYLLGTFHFAQTGKEYDITDTKHQESILELCELIEKQNPNKVFVERQPEYEYKNKVDGLFERYVKDDTLRYRNEIYQVGFRVAKNLGHPKVYQCDNPGMYGLHYRAALKYAKANDQLDILDGKAIGTTEREDDIVNDDSMMMNNSLLNYIRWLNSDVVMNSSHASYINTFTQIGSTDFYDYEDDNTLIGAELVADWYRRNILIYSKMINQLDYTEDAIFLIIGSDHVPIIRNLFRDNPYFEVVEPKNWLD